MEIELSLITAYGRVSPAGEGKFNGRDYRRRVEIELPLIIACGRVSPAGEGKLLYAEGEVIKLKERVCGELSKG